jgi:hypothetical protein
MHGEPTDNELDCEWWDDYAGWIIYSASGGCLSYSDWLEHEREWDRASDRHCRATAHRQGKHLPDL